MIHVAHFIHTMAYGGIETALLNWVRTTNTKLFRVSLYCFANADGSERPFIDAAHALGIPVRTVPWNRRKPVIQAVRALSRILREDKVQIIHCHNTYADLVGLIAGKRTGVKTVTTLYVWGKFGFVRSVLQWLDLRLLPFFDQVTAHCQDTFNGTVQRGFPAGKLRLLPCGFEAVPLSISAEERSAQRARLGATPEDFVLIHVARFWPEKAHDVLLEAFRMIVAERPQAKLWMLGIGPHMEEIQAMATRMGLGDRAVFLGFRTDLAEMLALADLQIHPSDMEGVPLAICQGMAQGLPVVATNVGGLIEVIESGISGILVEKRNPQRCARAVLELMDDPSRRQELGKAAARFIAEEYSLAAATRRVERVYFDVLSTSDPKNTRAKDETGS
jgi:glycosyltransferase involved in cell wall biosynthesis